MGARDRLASLLGRAGAVDVALRLRARARVPYLTILTYHHIDDPPPGYELDPGVADATPAQFERQLDFLARHCTVIGVGELCDALDGAPLPPNPAMITFDDGYRSCAEVALPMLAARNLRAVFFIPTWFVEERRLFWWERIFWLSSQAKKAGRTFRAPTELIKLVKNTRGLDLPAFLDDLSRQAGVTWTDALEHELTDRLLMSWDQIRALADAGMDIESHTRRHRVLQTLGAGELAAELRGSRDDLERVLGRAPRTIAYPVGRSIASDRTIRDAVERAGYRAGFTNQTGGIWMSRGRRPDPFDLGRVAVDRDLSDSLFAGQLAFPPLAYRT